jgi:hypothetical protein
MAKTEKRDKENWTEKDWKEWGNKMGKKWADKWADPEKWERRAHRGRIGFGLFVLVVGILWLLKDMGYIQKIPLFPVIFILFALFVLLLKM